MKVFYWIIALSLSTAGVFAQKADNAIDSKQFFIDQTPFNATLTTDMGSLLKKGPKTEKLKAVFSCKLADSSTVSEAIQIHTRGHFRHDYCNMPPLKLNFHNPTSPRLYPLNNLKLTWECRMNAYYGQLVLKEYLVYKIYNLITDKSFRVRLVNLTVEDEKKKRKPFNQYAFFAEDVGAMAKRNHCRELPDVKINTESTDRVHMTLVSVFEYMIGNTDWAVSVLHNIRLIRSKEDSLSRPFAVAYDFDYSGLVNAEYAIPDPLLNTTTVLERVYRGFPRTMEELDNVLKVFKEQKENIYSLVKKFDLLTNSNRSEMIGYLDDFYKQIGDKRMIQSVFIDNARTR